MRRAGKRVVTGGGDHAGGTDGEKVVVDLRSAFVCLGTLVRADEHFLELRSADLHDLRDTETSRELYVASRRRPGSSATAAVFC